MVCLKHLRTTKPFPDIRKLVERDERMSGAKNSTPTTKQILEAVILGQIANGTKKPLEEWVVEEIIKRYNAYPHLLAENNTLRDVQFSPSGDNHHNAAMCPHCGDPVRKLQAEIEKLETQNVNLTLENSQVSDLIEEVRQENHDYLNDTFEGEIESRD